MKRRGSTHGAEQGESQLPFLLHLLDDPSPEVREPVLRALEEIGPSLESLLARLDQPPTTDQLTPIQPLLRHNRMFNLRSDWPGWFAIEDDKAMLESAMGMLSTLETGELHGSTLTGLLDDLSSSSGNHADPLALAEYLFQEVGLGGAPEEDYYNPLNSNLIHVIESKRGIPLSLACVFILTAHRIGLRVEGCNFPGHFLTIVRRRGDPVIVDCYHGGTVIERSDLAEMSSNLSLGGLLRLECKAPVIIARALRNLVAAYENNGDVQSMELVTELLGQTESRFTL